MGSVRNTWPTNTMIDRCATRTTRTEKTAQKKAKTDRMRATIIKRMQIARAMGALPYTDEQMRRCVHNWSPAKVRDVYTKIGGESCTHQRVRNKRSCVHKGMKLDVYDTGLGRQS